MTPLEILKDLNLGSSVAEFDTGLQEYFVETDTFRSLIGDKGDIIAGDKGTGKTSLYKILQSTYRSIASLEDTEIITGFNPSGNPVFQRLAQTKVLDEGQYLTIWKAYIISLVGNWILQVYEGSYSDEMIELDDLLKKIDLRTVDDTPNTVFSKLVNVVQRLITPKSVELKMTISPQGMPILVPKVEFGEEAPPRDSPHPVVDHYEAFLLLNQVLAQIELKAWVVIDRLDEAFQGFPNTEKPALRALFRTYLDLLEFENIRLKLFVRNDLFRKIIEGGFVNLTHVNARRIAVTWNDEDLFDLLMRRIMNNSKVINEANLGGRTKKEIFAFFFPEQIDVGEKKPLTWTWILSRIRDGNGVKPPRNLIDLLKKARDIQIRKEERDPRALKVGESIFQADSIKRGLTSLSQERVEDTLLAEAGESAYLIQAFRDKKSEYDSATLS